MIHTSEKGTVVSMKALMERIKNRNRKRKSLKWSMVSMLLLGWFFPLFLITFLMFVLAMENINKQVENTIISTTEKAVEIMQMQLKDCETASKNASYIPIISKSYIAYQEDGNDKDFKDSVETFLKQQYKYNDNCKTAELILLENPEKRYFTLNNSNNATYQDIKFFEQYAQDRILQVAETLDTATTLVGVEGRIYMVRNLVNSSFQPYAVLALELDQDSLMQSYAGIWGYNAAALYWDNVLLVSDKITTEETCLNEEVNAKLEQSNVVYEQKHGEYSYVYRKMKLYQGTMVLVVQIENDITQSGLLTVRSFFLILVLFMIPLVIQILYFFHNKVNVPLEEVIVASNEVREGNLGMQIENREDSEEFCHLRDSFNHMSLQLKNQFDKIYLEEVALRDAKIMALQSQINPHFLNNTLEIINWEARLNGNYKVSGMIEALSTMLEATMNRKAKQFHSVAEEMAYADAYLYIISQRFGEKFKCKKQIDESLLKVQVPRLIIQPIVENAVEHGMDITKQGQLEIRLYQKEDNYLCIEIEDNGQLNKEKREKIDRLLSQEIDPTEEKRVSLGIRNVDQRLKMIYGMACGLFIDSNDKGHTVSTILIKTDHPTEQ